jgi:hypothetical protein
MVISQVPDIIYGVLAANPVIGAPVKVQLSKDIFAPERSSW